MNTLKIKRIISLMLAIVSLCLLLSGCGENKEDKAKKIFEEYLDTQDLCLGMNFELSKREINYTSIDIHGNVFTCSGTVSVVADLPGTITTMKYTLTFTAEGSLKTGKILSIDHSSSDVVIGADVSKLN